MRLHTQRDLPTSRSEPWSRRRGACCRWHYPTRGPWRRPSRGRLQRKCFESCPSLSLLPADLRIHAPVGALGFRSRACREGSLYGPESRVVVALFSNVAAYLLILEFTENVAGGDERGKQVADGVSLHEHHPYAMNDGEQHLGNEKVTESRVCGQRAVEPSVVVVQRVQFYRRGF
eukprot:5510349-Pleurochrysis_carterae.AAC.1